MKSIKLLYVFLLVSIVNLNTIHAAPFVYVPLGSGNQVIKINAASDTVTTSYTGVKNPHSLVAT